MESLDPSFSESQHDSYLEDRAEAMLVQRFTSSAGESLAGIVAAIDEVTGDAYIPWQHIENLFCNVRCVRAAGVDVKFLTDSNSNMYVQTKDRLHNKCVFVKSMPKRELTCLCRKQPPRIRYYPYVPLEVVYNSSRCQPSAPGQDESAIGNAVLTAHHQSTRATNGDVSSPNTNGPNSARCRRRLPADQLLLEAYNDLTVSYAQVQRLACGPPAETIKSLVASIGAVTLKEFTKGHRERAQVTTRMNRVLEIQQQALTRLTVIQNRVLILAGKTFELHENPIPRLFIVLPRTSEPLDRVNPSKNAFRIHFLCECDRNVTGQTELPPSKSPNTEDTTCYTLWRSLQSTDRTCSRCWSWSSMESFLMTWS